MIKVLKCGQLEYDPINELASYNGRVVSFGAGNKNAAVLQLLIKNKNRRVGYKTLIKHSVKNPVKLLILNDPNVWKNERLLLHQVIKNIKNKLGLNPRAIRYIKKNSYMLLKERCV